MRPPIARNTTAATALALISVCAAISTFSPVYGQVREAAAGLKAPMTVSAVMGSSPLGRAWAGLGLLAFGDEDLSGHHVVADPAELVADDAELAGFGRCQREHVLVAGMDLNVDVDRLQREAVLPVERGEVDAVAHALLELENRPPLPQPAEEIDVRPGGRLDHRDALLLPHRVLLGELLDLLLIIGRRDAIGLLVQILLADEMPGDHESEHEQAPQERDERPCELDAFDGLVPPDSLFRRRDSHGSSPCRSFCERDGGNLHHAPQDVENGRYGDADEKQQKMIVQNPLHRRDSFERLS